MNARRLPFATYYVVSAAVHAGIVGWAWARPSVAHHQESVEVQMVETIKTRRVELKPDPVLPPLSPRTLASTAPPVPRPRRAAMVSAPRHSGPPPAAPAALSPEPVDPVPSPAPAAAPAPVRLGISLSSAITGGGLPVPTGGGRGGPYGGGGDHSSDPEVGPVSRVTEVTVLPEAINAEVPRSEYPPAALDAGFEGAVTLKLVVDASGRVRRASILKDPGYGLGAAAVKIAIQYFRFRPGQRGGRAVATEIPFTVYFELP